MHLPFKHWNSPGAQVGNTAGEAWWYIWWSTCYTTKVTVMGGMTLHLKRLHRSSGNNKTSPHSPSPCSVMQQQQIYGRQRILKRLKHYKTLVDIQFHMYFSERLQGILEVKICCMGNMTTMIITGCIFRADTEGRIILLSWFYIPTTVSLIWLVQTLSLSIALVSQIDALATGDALEFTSRAASWNQKWMTNANMDDERQPTPVNNWIYLSDSFGSDRILL